ncbi:MAG: divergent polysaccharide deacetylase family protein [Candidatus Baltobacteraceae bacterium]
MPRRSSRRPGRTQPAIALVLLVVVAAAAGWWLLRPSRLHRPHRRVAVMTPTVAASPVLGETPTPEATEFPSAAPSPSLTPAPAPSALSPRPSGTVNPNAVKLALIVDDCGQWISTERGFIALGIPVTLSVLPDVPYTGEIAREASDAGKGVMLHLPMETLSGLNPGPGKVTTEMTDPQIVAQVEADLAQVPSARGVNNHEGSKASADARVMRDVIGVLAQHGDLFFIDSRTNAASVGEQTAQQLGVPTAARDVFLDNRADVAYTEGQLLEAVAVARRTGSAIAIGHPRPTTLAAVQAMIPRLEASGVEFVLAQDLVSSGSR